MPGHNQTSVAYCPHATPTQPVFLTSAGLPWAGIIACPLASIWPRPGRPRAARATRYPRASQASSSAPIPWRARPGAPRDPWTSPPFSAALRSRAGPSRYGSLVPLLDVFAAVRAGEDTTWSSSQRARGATPTSSRSWLAAKFQLWENPCSRGFRAALPGMVDGDKHAGLGRKHGLRGGGGCG